MGYNSRDGQNPLMITTIDKNAESSLNLMWSAFQRSQLKGVESSLKTPQSLLSPYWLPNYGSSMVLESEGAGVVVGLENARYYEGQRGQFLSEDPTFWGKQSLQNPQSLNSYSYAEGNPIVKKDPTGLAVSEYQPYIYSNGPSFGDIIGSYRASNIYSRGSLSSGSPANPYQCTVFANDFTQKQFGVGLTGNGNNISFRKDSGSSGIASTYKNGGAMMPQENDVISWSGGTYGHVGIVAQVQFSPESGVGHVYTAEQNWGTTNGLFVQTLTRSSDGTYSVSGRGDYSVQGWSRYEKNQSTLPTYTTTPATPAPKPAIKKPSSI